MGPILEFLVPDLDAAKEELLAKGCQVFVCEGKEAADICGTPPVSS
jgi:hypothetical protein